MRRLASWGVVLGLVASGCVADDRYREILTQNDMLQKTHEGLLKENERLKGELDGTRLLYQQSQAAAARDHEASVAAQVSFERLLESSRTLLASRASIGDITVDDAGKILLSDEVFFETGKAEIRKKSEETLKRLAGLLKDEMGGGRLVRIEGYTDDQPVVVNKDTYPSNWHLSGARALNVLLFLEGEGVDSKKLTFAGYGENNPRQPNASGRKGNKANRRVEIAILE